VTDHSHKPPSPIIAGLTGRCPRCGKGRLFNGFLSLAPRCEVCGLVVAGSALVVELLYGPPYWVHVLLWGPLILLTTLGPLRPVKGLLIALQYHHKAAEGQLVGRDAP
jgi:uncharacterized protein (DUF983 family)